jgi:N-acetylmuramoyl-L-alanine amidase
MRRVVIAVISFLLSFAVYADNAVVITGMRIFPGSSKSVMIFDLTSRTTGTVRFIPDERMLIVKFDNAVLNFRVANAHLRGTNIETFSAKQLIDHSVEFDIHTTGNVTWDTNYAVNVDARHTQMRLEIMNKDEPLPTVPEIKKTKQGRKKDVVHDEILKELGKYKDNIEKLRLEQQQVFGRARWEKYQLDNPQNRAHVFTVVIDPGHGGKDTGAIGKGGIYEKEIVLNISKKIAARLQKIPGLQVILTRRGDYFVPLRGRLNVARRHDADLFIAVHADAYFNNTASGASVYALSQHGATSEAARWLVQQESHSELDGIQLNKLQDKSSMVRSVLIDLSQTATIRDSMRLGNHILDSLDHITPLHYKQVELAPFVVLKSPDIPSILIETGFISNSQEEMKLTNPYYQNQIADAVTRGVKSYIRRYAAR